MKNTNERPVFDIATLDRFVEWLQTHKDMSPADMRTSLLYGFTPPPLRDMGYFRSDRERYLRREVVDEFLRGKDVDIEELREGVYSLVVGIRQAGDAVRAAHKKQERDRHRPRPYGSRI